MIIVNLFTITYDFTVMSYKQANDYTNEPMSMVSLGGMYGIIIGSIVTAVIMW